MEQTIGNRIVSCRKKLGLTQDQLAEKLGVTAQAVSKWENDQSCPDISMLPKLAEIFGITVDELLGREAPRTVHQAEVIDDDDSEDPDYEWDDASPKKGGWEFKWDSGRASALAFAALVLVVGCLCFASNLLDWGASFWEILWPSALLIFGIKGLFHKFSFFSIGCALFGGYFLGSNLNAWNLDLRGELVFPAVLVLFGLSLLVDALHKPKKPRFTVTHNGRSHKRESYCRTEGEHFTCSVSFGEEHQLVQLPRLSGGDVTVSFGEASIDLSGCEKIADRCTIDANCSFGELRLQVPRRYRVECDNSTAFASVNIQGQPSAEPVSVICVNANVSFGEITIQYI